MPRIAVIGCGAIADSFHLPALRKGAVGEARITLVDPDAGRAEALARKHGAERVARSHTEVIGEVDWAIVASPHHTHFPVAMDLLSAGVPVLSEKPLATSVAEVEALAATARERDLPLGVNQTRRFIPACGEIRQLIQAGALGEVRLVDAAEGDRFGWPAATPSMFGRLSGGRGVLLDIGVHALDLLTWWLGDDLGVESYLDDSFGGSEAATRVRLSGAGIEISLRLSWLAKQRNSYRIEGTLADLEWGLYDLDALTLRSRATGGTTRVQVKGPRNFEELAGAVLADFGRAVASGGTPAVSGEDVLPSIRLIEECYARRRRFDMPWHSFTPGVAHAR